MAFDLSSAQPVGAGSEKPDYTKVRRTGLIEQAIQGATGQPVTAVSEAYPGELPGNAGGGLGEQFRAGLEKGAIGTVGRAGLEAAGGEPEQFHAPEGAMQNLVRGAGEAIAGIADLGLGKLFSGIAPEAASALRTASQKSPVLTGMAGGGLVTGGLNAAKQYGDTGEVDPSQIVTSTLVGAGLGGLIPGAVKAGGVVANQRAKADLTAAKALTGTKDVAEAPELAPQQPGQLLTQTTPNARAYVAPATATPEGQAKLAGIVGGQAEETQRALRAPTNLPLEPTLPQIAQEPQVTATKAAEAAGKDVGTPTDMASLGERIIRPAMQTMDKLHEERKAAVQPFYEARDKLVAAKEQQGQQIDVTDLAERLRSNPTLSALEIAPKEGSETIDGRIVPLPAQKKIKTLADYLETPLSAEAKAPPAEGATQGVTTSFDQLKVVEKELKRASSATQDPQTKSVYTNTLKQVQGLLDNFTKDGEGNSLEAAARSAYLDASGPINRLTQLQGNIAPKATEAMQFTKHDAPLESITPYADPESLAKSVLPNATQRQGEELKLLLGPNASEKLVGDYLAGEIKGKNAAAIDKLINDRAGLLSEHPQALDRLKKLRDAATTAEEKASGAVVPAGTSEVGGAERIGKLLASGSKEDLEAFGKELAGSKASPKMVKEKLIDAVSQHLADKLTPLTDLKRTGIGTLSGAKGGVDSFAQESRAIRERMVGSGLLTDADMDNIDKLLSGIRVVGKNPTETAKTLALENALTSSTPEQKEKPWLKLYAALSAKLPGAAPKAYYDPMKGINEKAQLAIKQAMVDPEVTARLAKRLAAAKTTAQKARVIAGNASLKAILAGHWAQQAMAEDDQ